MILAALLLISLIFFPKAFVFMALGILLLALVGHN
ncbi:MAG: hypothetical protein HPY66_1684 [Firmicutes bacterium]|nr:hypothetical protein [Bacillota bacterium]